MESLGVVVERRPFELHPELPPEGRAVRNGSALSDVFRTIDAECHELGIPFKPPERTPNSRLALNLAAAVAERHPDRFRRIDDSISDARWIDGADIADPDVLEGVLEAHGLPLEEVADVTCRPPGGDTARLRSDLVELSMADARDAGIAATPAWRFETGFVIPGVQSPETVTRWVTRLMANAT